MKRAMLLCSLLLFSASMAMAQGKETGFLNRSVTMAGVTYKYQVYVPADYSDAQQWPVILFLHGSGERGVDGIKQTAVGLPAAVRMDASRFPAIVVLPQSPNDSAWTGTPAQAAMAALDAVMKQYRTDPDRVYLTGLSMGGHGTWYLAYRYADRFAAIAPVCGWVSTMTGIRLGRETVVPVADGAPFDALARKLANKPVWIFHGEQDPSVPVVESRMAYEALKSAGGNVRYTEYLGTGHNSWDATYGSPTFTSWLFAQKRQATVQTN